MPDRVNEQNVVWFVAEHEGRLSRIDNKVEDLGVIRRDLGSCREDVGLVRREIAALRDHVDGEIGSIRRALYTFALSVAASAVIFALSLFAIFK